MSLATAFQVQLRQLRPVAPHRAANCNLDRLP